MFYYQDERAVMAFNRFTPTVDPVKVWELNEDISSVVQNRNGTRVAVASNQLVYVFDVTIGPQFRCREIVTADDKVEAITWHPLAHSDELLVLTCSELKLVAETTETLKLQAENLPITAKSFSFGSKNTTKGLFTLYISTRDGDIYELFPLLPKQLSLTAKQEEDTISLGIRQSLKYRFVANDQNAQPLFVMEREAVKSVHYNLNPPLMLQPYPDELYSETFHSLCVSDFGLKTDVLVQSSDNQVNFWALADDNAGLCVRVGSIKYKTSGARKVYASGLYTIVEGDKCQLFVCNSQFQSKPELLNTFDSARFVTENTSENVCETPYTISILADGNFQTLSATSPSIGAPNLLASKLKVKPLVSKSFSTDVENELKEIDQPIQMPEIDLDGNLLALRELMSASDTVRLRTERLFKLSERANSEIQAQRQESVDQKAEVSVLTERVKTLAARREQARSKLEEIKKLNLKLTERFSAAREQANKVLNSETAPPSRAESLWFDEVRSTQVSAVDNIEQGLESLLRSVRDIRSNQVFRLPGDLTPSSSLTETEISDLKKRLMWQDMTIHELQTLNE